MDTVFPGIDRAVVSACSNSNTAPDVPEIRRAGCLYAGYCPVCDMARRLAIVAVILYQRFHEQQGTGYCFIAF